MRKFNTAGPVRAARHCLIVVECKPIRGGRDRTLRKGLQQTAAHMDLCGTEAGHLVVFDVRGGRSWKERIFREEHAYGGKRITVWGA